MYSLVLSLFDVSFVIVYCFLEISFKILNFTLEKIQLYFIFEVSKVPSLFRFPLFFEKRNSKDLMITSENFWPIVFFNLRVSLGKKPPKTKFLSKHFQR